MESFLNENIPREDSATVTEQVFEAIRSDILICRLRPGGKLRQIAMREAYGASGSAIREALSKLCSLGLVTSESQRGFRVAETSPEDLVDLTKTRINVEALALRSAIENGGRQWEARILAAEHMLGGNRQKFVLRHLSSPAEDDRRARHLDFHDALVSGCKMTNLLTFRATLTALSDRYRFLSALSPSDRNVPGEHRAITKAVLDRDQEKAILYTGVHFLMTAAAVLGEIPGFKSDTGMVIERLWRDISVATAASLGDFEKARSLFIKEAKRLSVAR